VLPAFEKARWFSSCGLSSGIVQLVMLISLEAGENSPEKFVGIFQEVCETQGEDDGLRFNAATVTAQPISEDADYQRIPVKFVGFLENACISIQIDPGFGDVITPEAAMPMKT
jgi:hypothetical protein